jgi:hypothetical protein
LGARFKIFTEGLAGAALMALALLTPFLQSRRNRWGANDAELKRSLPGDELLSKPKWMWTHAITIDAPVDRGWPWLVQIGQGRGGFYSYEFLENLVGCDIHNADRIIPELQNLKVGDGILLHPKAPPLPVALIEPLRELVLHAKDYSPAEESREPAKVKTENNFSTLWGFYLDKIDDNTTRLIIRWKVDYNPTLKNRASYGPLIIGPIGFIMDRKMLLGIKMRAESTAR